MNATSAAVTVDYSHPHVALVTIQRPEARNAINVEVTQALGRIVEETEANPDVWAAILSGAGGKAFCAGADLKEIAAGRALQLATPSGGFAGFVLAARTKPWIAAVDGLALGGGCELALACDMIVASEGSTFGLPETSRGLIAAAGGLYRLPRVLPRNIALELITTGARLSAERAHAFGMVNQVSKPGAAVEAAVKMAALICANAPLAVRESLKIARTAADHDEAQSQAMTREAMARVTQSADYQEGPRAFIEKRPPTWTGR